MHAADASHEHRLAVLTESEQVVLHAHARVFTVAFTGLTTHELCSDEARG